MKPTPADILVAIGRAAAGNWIDPAVIPVRWSCDLYAPDGRRAGDGDGSTAGEAMAFAWLAYWAPDALITGCVELGGVPYVVPDDWRFELTPSWHSKDDIHRPRF